MADLVELDSGQHPHENPVAKWRAKFAAGELQIADLVEFFERIAPNFFRVNNTLSTVRCDYDESSAMMSILDVLDKFIFGDNPETVLQNLKSEEHFPPVCGRILKFGDTSYRCTDCASDETSVLCGNCFMQSEHRFHMYKISTAGGGCCDCGDKDAWKRDAHCEEHLKAKNSKRDSDFINKETEEKCNIVFRAVLKSCIQFLQLEPDENPEPMRNDNQNQSYCLLLYRNDCHDNNDSSIFKLTSFFSGIENDLSDVTFNFDVEGRIVVTRGALNECLQIRNIIQRRMSMNLAHNLKVIVLNETVVSCEQFAQQLLKWLTNFLKHHFIFRKIFGRIIVAPEYPECHVRLLFGGNFNVWRAAKTSWHELMHVGMTMDYDNKKKLSNILSYYYPTILHNFIMDDYEYATSIVCMGFQVFRVPSIAHHLIAKNDILHTLLYVYQTGVINEYVKDKVVHFPRNILNLGWFEKSKYVLLDIESILSCPPKIWTRNLREGFLRGVDWILKLLNLMHGMDAIRHQIGQHVDYDYDWKTGSTVQMNITSIITMFLEWCGKDRKVLITSYAMVSDRMTKNDYALEEPMIIEEKNHLRYVVRCLKNTILLKPISIHIPLTRFFAGLYLHLTNYKLNYHNLRISRKRSPEEIIEPVLCAKVLMAQIRAGMWRRNGQSLLQQINCYQSVKFRTETLEKDILALQIGATLIESNEFLIHILNKFDLLKWVQMGYEESIIDLPEDDAAQQLTIVDEFLELLIAIISERYMPGVSKITKSDKIKYEMIQQLCVDKFSHSTLCRKISKPNSDTALDEILDTLTVPVRSPNNVVLYELKEEFYDKFNMYCYYYSSEEKSKAEEFQCMQRKKKGLSAFSPPPKLPQLENAFELVSNLLHCDVMLSIMAAVLQRALQPGAKCFSENHLHRVLYLIGYGLQEEGSGNYPFLTFSNRSQQFNILSYLEELRNHPKYETQLEFVAWAIRKFIDLQPKSNIVKKMECEKIVEVKSMIEDVPNNCGKSTIAKQVAARRAALMAEIRNAQMKFRQDNSQYFEDDTIEDFDMSMNSQDNTDQEKILPCLGPDKHLPQQEEEKFECILCFDGSSVDVNAPGFVYPVFIQKSKLLSTTKAPANGAPFFSTCGHAMHMKCWKEYFNSEAVKDSRRLWRSRSAINLTPDLAEYHCPYCRCLCNSIIPVTPSLRQFAPIVYNEDCEFVATFNDWLTVVKHYLDELYYDEQTTSQLEEPWIWVPNLPALNETMNHFNDVSEYINLFGSLECLERNAEWFSCSRMLMSTMKQIVPYPHCAPESESYLLLWNSCSYTIQCLEVYFRASNTPLSNDLPARYKCCLTSLIRLSMLIGVVSKRTVSEKLSIHLRGVLEIVLNQKGPCVLEWDIFQMLASVLFLTMAGFYANNGDFFIPTAIFMDYYLLQFMFMANIAKALVLYEAENNSHAECDRRDLQKEESNVHEKCVKNITYIYKTYNIKINTPDRSVHFDSDDIKKLIDHIATESNSFLRCCCLLFHFMTGVDFPQKFSDPDGANFENMCKYLNLNPDIECYFSPDSEYFDIIKLFSSHPDIVTYNCSTRTKPSGSMFDICPCVTPIPQLTPIPNDFLQLISTEFRYPCPNNCNKIIKDPILCLACGSILYSEPGCCQLSVETSYASPSVSHIRICGEGAGMFLRIRDCQLCFLSKQKGCFMPPPYLDKYGETDAGLRKGSPLYLCHEMYRKLHLTWLSHGLHDEVARQYEIQGPFARHQWQLMHF